MRIPLIEFGEVPFGSIRGRIWKHVSLIVNSIFNGNVLEVRIQCKLCQMFVDPNNLDRHLVSFHPEYSRI